VTGTDSCRAACVATLVVALVAASAALAARAAAPPAGQPAPAQLVGLYAAHFTLHDRQTSGTWHLRIGPGHHLKVWNTGDGVANTPSFEGGPVSFRGPRMIFATNTAAGVCTVGATYGWTFQKGLLRFRSIGKDGCGPRVLTFTPHPWKQVSE
jgi:hypothetical protein